MEVYNHNRKSRFFAFSSLICVFLALLASAAFFLFQDFQTSRADSQIPLYRADHEPTRLEIPALNLSAPITPVGLDSATRQIAVPDHDVGWFEPNAAPQDPGVVFLVGHNDGIFQGLEALQIGDHLTIHLASDTIGGVAYQVYSISTEVRESISMRQVLAPEDYTHELVVMTCAGDFNHAIDTYTHRLIIRARRT
ncbi:class F sortase [Candidatus Saccharibacteria bacterium]|nr:class F sortase [Candidatus Saccharibacteria bacterium]